MYVHLSLTKITTWIWTQLWELFWFFLHCSMRGTPKFVGNHFFAPLPTFLIQFLMYYAFEPACFVVFHHSHTLLLIIPLMWPHLNHSFSDILTILECIYIYNLTPVHEEMYSTSEHLQVHLLQHQSYVYQQVCKMVNTIIITYCGCDH